MSENREGRGTIATLRALLEKATPAPWSATDNDGETSFGVNGGGPEAPHDYNVCEISWWACADGTHDVNKSDGHLIAALRNAAPDLLRVVEAVSALDDDNYICDKRRCPPGGHADDCVWVLARKLTGAM